MHAYIQRKLRWQRNLARHASALFSQTSVHECVLCVLKCHIMQEWCRLMACEKAGRPRLARRLHPLSIGRFVCLRLSALRAAGPRLNRTKQPSERHGINTVHQQTRIAFHHVFPSSFVVSRSFPVAVEAGDSLGLEADLAILHCWL